MNFYNDIDPQSCAWMRQLVADKLIPAGDVVCKSITDLTPDELKSYTQVHLFGGIAGWPAALDLAGWSTDMPVWTISCPCPPFSCAGKKKACPQCEGKPIPHPYKTGIFACIECGHEWLADGRHLWPEALRLIRECRPSVCIGEQVAGADGLIWLSGVRATMEALGYAFGSADLCAASVSAPHRRQRIFWVAILADSEGGGQRVVRGAEAGNSGGHTDGDGELGDAGFMRCYAGKFRDERGQEGARSKPRPVVDRSGQPDLMAHGEQPGLEGHAGHGADRSEPGRQRTVADGSVAEGGGDGGVDNTSIARRDRSECNTEGQARDEARLRVSDIGRQWSDYEIIHFRDGTKRRIERGTPALAPGLSKGVVRGGDQSIPINPQATAEARRMRLSGYGNAIVVPLAAEFIKAFAESVNIQLTK
jgi:DNA (cytosine-5)-methyltransferase 1